MRSHGEGSLSATTQVKVLSPEILLVALGQGFHVLEANIRACAIVDSPLIGLNRPGECVSDVPGSESVAGNRTVYIGTWENRSAPFRSCQEAEEVTRQYGVSVVGLIHSRGVGRVIPVESRNKETLEGVSSLTQREGVCHAIH